MKVLLLILFVAAVSALPIPEDGSDAVEMIVNGVPEGEALDISHIVDIKLKEHVEGEVVAATNLLHPYTAVGIAEAAAAAAVNVVEDSKTDIVLLPVVFPEAAESESVVPEAVVLPSPIAPEVVAPEPVVLPSPVVPEVVVPEPVVLPSPTVPEVVLPEPIVLPSPAVPEVVPEVVVQPEEVPNPAPQYNDLYNDGLVQVSVNGPEEPSILSTLQSWFNMVINYFNNGAQTSSHQIV